MFWDNPTLHDLWCIARKSIFASSYLHYFRNILPLTHAHSLEHSLRGCLRRTMQTAMGGSMSKFNKTL